MNKIYENFLVSWIIGTVFLVAYVINVIKLSECDFQAPYRCEVIHVVGLFPPAQIVTSWFDSDKKNTNWYEKKL